MRDPKGGESLVICMGSLKDLESHKELEMMTAVSALLCWRRGWVIALSTAPFSLPPFLLPSLLHFLRVS